MNQPAKALLAYEADLKKHPNRFNGLFGAGQAAEKAGDSDKAGNYYHQLIGVAGSIVSNRAEQGIAKAFFKKEK